MEVKKERFYNVDLIRFVLALEIILFHFGLLFKNSNPFFTKINSHFCHGFICVEFFFIISGFFLFKNLNPEENTIEFVKKRLIRLLPIKYFTLGICSIMSLFIKSLTISFNKIIMSLLLLNCIGFNQYKTGPIEVWYISVLFWVSLFYFYISKLLNKKWLNLIIWLIVVLSCSYVLNCNFPNYVGIYKNTYLFFNQGVIRGLFGVGIGYFIAMLYKSNVVQNLKTNKFLITGLEVYSLLFLVYYLTINNKVPGGNYLNYIIIFSIFFYLLLIKQGFFSKLLNNKTLSKLGQYAYSLYVIHWVIYIIMKHSVFKLKIFYTYPEIFFLLCISTAIISGILAFYLVEKPTAKYLKEKFLNIQKPINNQVLPK